MATSPNCLDATHTLPPTISVIQHDERSRSHLSLRREKPQLSCNLCRKRKVRCDRQNPCATCSRRGLARSCAYSTDAQENILPWSAGTVHERIHQLESLVISLMRQNTTNPACATTDSISISDPPNGSAQRQSVPLDGGCMKFNSLGTANYVGSSHWAAILDSMAELKEHFEPEEELCNIATDFNPPNSIYSSGSQLLYGCQRVTKAEIRSSIPPRRATDRLVSRYFTLDIASGVIHSGHFFVKYVTSPANVSGVMADAAFQYDHFWDDPSAAPIMWVGLLFTIMCLGELHNHSLTPMGNIIPMQTLNPVAHLAVNKFRERIVQCLMLGKYTKGGPYVLESLLQYYMVEHFLCQDAEFEIWILLGMLIPISLRMGLHRDPKHFNEVPAFAGEMRRRVWATIFQIDVGFSALAGLPRMIKPQQCDAEEPRNLLDSDFDEKTLELPPSRPESESTPILFLLAKNRIISVGGLVSDLAHDIQLHPYSDIMKAEKLLQDTRHSLPSSLQWQPLSQSIIAGPRAIMQRVYLDMFFHKMRIILYKKYLSASMTQSHYSQAREVCLDSAIKILEYQHLLDEETKLDSRLFSVRWTYSSILNHDFMLAASVLCFYIKQCNGEDNDFIDQETFQKIRSLLRKSHEIWLCSSSASNEAQKAVQSLSFILGLRHRGEEEEITNCFDDGSTDHFPRFNNPASWPVYQDYSACSNLTAPLESGTLDTSAVLDFSSFEYFRS